jgi:hypothetical protein
VETLCRLIQEMSKDKQKWVKHAEKGMVKGCGKG